MNTTTPGRTRSTSRLKPGQVFGHWQVIRRAETDKPSDYYLCRCVCGKEKTVEGGSLRKGNSSSCGCQAKKAVRPPGSESKSTQPEAQHIFNLIAQGYLPPADQFSAMDGSPCWSLRSVAIMLGVKADELEQHVLAAGRRFKPDANEA